MAKTIQAPLDPVEADEDLFAVPGTNEGFDRLVHFEDRPDHGFVRTLRSASRLLARLLPLPQRLLHIGSDRGLDFVTGPGRGNLTIYGLRFELPPMHHVVAELLFGDSKRLGRDECKLFGKRNSAIH